jgi:hypothetical protein
MSRETVALLTIGVLLFSNFIGLIYSMIVLKTVTFNPFIIQTKA